MIYKLLISMVAEYNSNFLLSNSHPLNHNLNSNYHKFNLNNFKPNNKAIKIRKKNKINKIIK